MKIVVTGSLGNISKPLTQVLVQKGHSVKVISSKAGKEKAIEAMGAEAAVGSMEDVEFLVRVFEGADAVYCMIPLSFSVPDLPAYLRQIAGNYLEALKRTGVKRVVVLSGWSANLLKGENVEDVFDGLGDVWVTILRPASFYTNFYSSMDLIRGKGFLGALMTLRYSGILALLRGRRGMLMGNCGGDDPTVFVSPEDIADAAAEELLSAEWPRPEKGVAAETKKIRYVGSDEMTCNEAAAILGASIGKPWLKWVLLSDKEMFRGLKMAKMPDKVAEMLVEMQAVMHSGAPLRNFHQSKPVMGKRKLRDFAKEFAGAYHKKYSSR